jgi:hypothetical protein
VSQKRRKRIEEIFGWLKTSAACARPGSAASTGCAWPSPSPSPLTTSSACRSSWLKTMPLHIREAHTTIRSQRSLCGNPKSRYPITKSAPQRLFPQPAKVEQRVTFVAPAQMKPRLEPKARIALSYEVLTGSITRKLANRHKGAANTHRTRHLVWGKQACPAQSGVGQRHPLAVRR